MVMGLPAEVTSWPRRSISEKAAWRPYFKMGVGVSVLLCADDMIVLLEHTHCGSYCLRPTATVIGSSNVALSSHNRSFLRDGRPAKRSRTLPTSVFCWSLRVTPSAALMLVFSMLRSVAVDVVSLTRSVYFDSEAGIYWKSWWFDRAGALIEVVG